MLNARIKLNMSYLYGGLAFAALIGWLTNSFIVFIAVAVLLTVGAVHAGDIRLSPPPNTRLRR